MTGRWYIVRHDQSGLGYENDFVANVTQTGTALATDVGYAGTIDTGTGAFHLERTFPCFTLENGQFPVPDTIDGTVDPGGNTLAGTFSTGAQVGRSCLQITGLVEGQRVDTALCGNLVLDPGEECDGGACCAADCTFLPTGTVCGTDPATCFDYTCYPSHQCLFDSTSQPDHDGDGIADRCDLCTGGGPIVPSRLVIDDVHLAARGTIVLPTSAMLDPVVRGLRVRLVDLIRVTLLDVTVPGGAYDPSTRTGWTSPSRGHGWRYRGPAGPAERITLTATEPAGAVRVRLRGEAPHPTTTPVLPLKLTFVLDPPLAMTGLCGELFYEPPDATRTATTANRIVCLSGPARSP